MEGALSSNGIIMLLLGMVSFLLVRLLKGIDKTAEALTALEKTVQGLAFGYESLRKDQTRFHDEAEKEHLRLEGDFLRRSQDMAQSIEITRGRLHDLTNKFQGVFSRFELSERNRV